MIVPGQVGVMLGSMNPTATGAIVNTTGSGTRSIEFNTSGLTEAKTYTIEVKELAPGDKSDDVKVKVEAGSVTVTASGTGNYYIGEEITFSGTNTEGETVYLFMTGPNLDRDGVNPTNVTDTTPYPVSVEADDTWSYKWNSAATTRNIDAGSYTIYAVSKNVNKDGLSSAKYDTVSVSLRSGFISATTSGATVARGNDLTISGTAQGNPDNVFIWIFGKNYYGAVDGTLDVLSPSPESDGSFEEDVNTDDLSAGQYFVVVQHPMGVTTGNAGSINWGVPTGWITGPSIMSVQLTNLQAPAAAAALINALDSPNIPDTYVKLTFVVAEPQLFIDAIGDKAAGSKFTITGTTNLAVGDTLNIQVTSAAFQPGQKTEGSTFSGVGGSAIIQQGDGANTWSFEVDGASFKPDQYIVNVESIETDTTATATFNVIEATATTQPTGSVTATPTGTETTPTGTAATAATPTQSPGFGALIALAGLGAVAFLVLRRN
jgi:Predicted solute binding protein